LSTLRFPFGMVVHFTPASGFTSMSFNSTA
jgi:hypothetical protein